MDITILFNVHQVFCVSSYKNIIYLKILIYLCWRHIANLLNLCNLIPYPSYFFNCFRNILHFNVYFLRSW